MIRKLILLIVICLVVTIPAIMHAQAVSIWTNPITGTNPSNSNPYTTGDVKSSYIQVSGIGRSGVTSVRSTNSYNADSWGTAASINTTRYFSFIVTPIPGYKVSFSSFVYTGTRETGNGGQSGPTSFAFRSDAGGDNYTTNIGSPTAAGTTISLAGSSFQNINSAVQFRFYGWNAGNNGEYSINDFTFNGGILGSATTSLSGFTYVYGSGPSTAQSFSVNGVGLNSSNAVVTITGSTSYEVSTTSATTGFSNSVTLTASGGSITNATVWVRLKAGASPASYTETISFGGGGITGIAISCSGIVTPKNLTVTAPTANSKVYDGTTVTTVGGSLTGIEAADNGNVSLSTTGNFTNKNAGFNKSVTFSITGTAASKYVLVQPSVTANITVRSITVTATASNKVYDGTTTATASLSDNRITGDVITVSGTATFNNKNAGTGKTVTVNGLVLSGTDAGNYTLASTSVTTTASITARNLTVTATGINKIYDGTTAATVTFNSDRIAGDVVTFSGVASFDTKNTGSGKSVTVSGLVITGGADAANYILANTSTATTASITARSLTVTAIGNNKVYDGTTAATVIFSDGRIGGDVIVITGSARFDTKQVGTGKTVTVSGLSITGADAANYTLGTATITTTATITPRSLTLSATALNKVYDGTTAATAWVNGDPVTGDSILLSHTNASFDTKHAGIGKPVTVSSISLEGPDGMNYSLPVYTVLTTANITPVVINITPTAGQSKIEGDVDPSFSFTAVPNPVGADRLTGFLGRSAGDTIGVYQYTLGTLTASGDYLLNLNQVNDFRIYANISTARFRSKASGDFSNKNSWEYFDGFNWQASTQAPGNGNSVTIRSGHSIVLDFNFSVGVGKTLLLETGGSLSVLSGKTMTIYGHADFNNQNVVLKSDIHGTGSIGYIENNGDNLVGADSVVAELYMTPKRAWKALTVPLRSVTTQTIWNQWQNNGVEIPNTGGLFFAPSPNSLATTGYSTGGSASNLRTYTNGSNGTGTVFTTPSSTKTAVLFDANGPRAYMTFIPDQFRSANGSGNINSGFTSTTLKAKGTLYKGTYTSGLLGTGYHFIPNPYPSSINLTESTLQEVGDQFWVWDPRVGRLGGYVTISAGVAVPKGGSYPNNPNGNSRLVPAGSAFWVYSSGNKTVSLNESNKMTGAFVLSRVVAANEIVSVNLSESDGTMLFDGVSTVYGNKYSNSIENPDAVKFATGAETISLRRAGKDFAIEFREVITERDTIFLRLNGLQQKQYRLDVYLDNFSLASGLTAYLQDLYLKTETLLIFNESRFFNFTVSATTMSTGDRFRIIFRPSLTTPVSNLEAGKGIQLYPSPVNKGQLLQLELRNMQAGKIMVTIHDALGRRVQQFSIQHPGGTITHPLTLSASISPGTYFAEIIPSKGAKETLNIVVK